MTGFSASGPWTSRVRAMTGARLSRIQRSRSITSGPFAPKRSTLPSPSFRLEQALLPPAGLSTTHIGIDGQTIPAIGPTASW